MALGTTNIGVSNIYTEMGKGGGSNQSLGYVQFGANDIYNADFTYDHSGFYPVSVNNFKSYNHLNMEFRYLPALDGEADTYGTGQYQFYDGNPACNLANCTQNTNNLEFNGTNEYAIWDVVAGGKSYKPGASGVGVIAAWIQPQNNGAGQVGILVNDQPSTGAPTAYYGHTWNFYGTNNKIRFTKGDGTGAASSDRRSFETAGALASAEWNFVAIQISYNSNTVSTSAVYSWVWNGSTQTWTNGATFLSGTGGNMAYNSSTGRMIFSAANSGGVYFAGSIGPVWAFDQSMSTADIENLWGASKNYFA